MPAACGRACEACALREMCGGCAPGTDARAPGILERQKQIQFTYVLDHYSVVPMLPTTQTCGGQRGQSGLKGVTKVGKQIVAGKLLGVADGPVILIEVRGEERGFPLDCQLTVDWVYSHMGKPITCMVTDGRVTEVG